MKRWRVDVFVTVHGRMSAQGYWYQGTFKHWRVAYVVARVMAWWCDVWTPDNGCCWNVQWGILDLKQEPSPVGGDCIP